MSARRLDISQTVVTISSNKDTILQLGSWHLNLGEGLDFLIKIFPRPHQEVSYSRSIIFEGPTKRSKTSKAVRSREKGATGQRPQSSTSNRASLECLLRRELIGQTSLTKVFRDIHKGRVVAAKVCRHPSLKWAADAWTNEASILSRLKNHVGPASSVTDCCVAN